MTVEIVLRYTHFLSIFLIVATLSGEYLLLKKKMTRYEIARLARIDALYGIAALALLAAGFTLWFGGFGKPTIYYSKNWVFHLKISLFVVIGLLSIKPTIFFLRQRKGDRGEMINIPSSIFWMLRMELALLTIIPLLAGLMSKGIGYFGK